MDARAHPLRGSALAGSECISTIYRLLESKAAEPESVSADPDDDYLFALARSGRAELIVSGDRHLTEVVRPVPPVVTPRAFVRRLSKRRG